MTDSLFTTLNVAGVELEVPTGLVLGGQWRPGSAGETFNVLDAATGSPIAEVHSATQRDAEEAMDIAAATQAEWGASAPRERAEILRKLYELVMEHEDELAALQSYELVAPSRIPTARLRTVVNTSVGSLNVPLPLLGSTALRRAGRDAS